MVKRNKYSKHISSRLRGGMISSPAAYPQGTSWESSVNTWPGVQGNTTQFGNYYKYNTNVEPLPESIINTIDSSHTIGGRRTKYRRKYNNKARVTKRTNRTKRTRTKRGKSKRHIMTRRGGSKRDLIMPQEIVNGYRGIQNNFQKFISDWQGVSAPVSPLPVDQTLQGAHLQYSPIDVPTITARADSVVSKL